ncbi:MAG: NnrS family protein [Gammaproteobacteria bacterium]|nr:MAG: NnrS family protein [Gammaproteobacteria bacterium]
MLNIVDPEKTSRIVPLFRLPFRPFFLGGALFSLVALALWGGFWLTGMHWAPYGGWLWWHAHEMLFGFVSAIIAGFLLTAVQNWTGQDSINGRPLAALCLLWLLPRLLLLYPVEAIDVVVPWLDLAFLPAVAWVIGRLVWRVRQFRHLVFIPVLLLLATSNAQMHWALVQGDGALIKQASHSAIFLIVLLMVVLGGRVIPFFTARGTETVQSKPNPAVEILSIASVAALALIQLFGFMSVLPVLAVAGLFLLAGVTHLLRLLSWRPWITLKIPLLWSLHCAYLFVVLGFFLCAFRFAGLTLEWFNGFTHHYATILHSFTLGGMGLLILSMISRVSLGHTGRPLVVSPWISFGFICLCIAYVCRVWLPLFWPGSSHYSSYLLSIVFWLLGYGLFVTFYLPILCQSRVDGRPG